MKLDWRPFEEARAFARTLGLQGWKSWNAYCKSGARPADIPAHPKMVYSGQFQSIEDWLGAAKRSPNKKSWRSFEEARAFAHTLGIKNQVEWRAYCRSGDKPDDIPSNPQRVYASEFQSFGDWLGTGFVATRHRLFRDFAEARAFVRSLALKNQAEWSDYCRSGDKPDDIPSNPQRMYRGQFVSMGDWLGTGMIAFHKRSYLPFEQARAFVHTLGLKNTEEWGGYCRSGNRPLNIPSNPHFTYQGQFVSMGDWLGTGAVSTRLLEFLPFEQARAFARSLGLQNQKEWHDYRRSDHKPANIPTQPAVVYKEQYRGMADWLGTFNTWQKATMLALLQDLRPHLADLEERELYIILQQAGALPALRLALGAVSPMQILRDLVECSGEGIERALRNRDSNDLISGAEADNPEEMLTDSDLAALDSRHFFESDDHQDLGEASPALATRSNLGVLDALTKQGANWLDDGATEYLISNRVNALWERYMSEGHLVVEELQNAEGGVFFTEITRRFLAEVFEIEELSIPQGWSFRDATGTLVPPNAMQRRTAWLVRERWRVGNWSGTGAGKTLAAVLSARVCDARLTLVITNSATIEGWRRQILAAYPDSEVLYEVPDRRAPRSFLVLNYEQFQTRTRGLLVEELIALGPDLVVFDEVQLVKQRDARASLRRQAIEALVEGLSARNPDLRILGMSATPVINNLLEAKKLLELIMGTSFAEDIKATVHNALAMHRLLMRYGFRFRPRYEQELRTHTPAMVRNDLLAPLLEAHTSILAIEQLLLPAKLEAMRPYLRRGALIYTHYVEGMIEPICQFIQELGFSVGCYIGEEKTGLVPFLSGKIDVLIGSSPVGTGLDGLQRVCDRLIMLSLPWTGAAYEQVIGRVRRQGSMYGSIDIIVPQVLLEAGQERWSWDAGRMEVIQYKRTLSDCAIDGHIPETVRLHETMLLQRSREALERWIAQAGGGEARGKEAVRQSR
jgi:superfamily II DNA or RNA helicase